MSNLESDYIDLTNSFELNDHRDWANDLVIVLDTDDSINADRSLHVRGRAKRKKNQAKHSTYEIEDDIPIVMCTICWGELGCKPLASTICGHVYCLQCLEQWFHRHRKCPTCRRTFKGAKSYHPIYLNNN